MRRRRCTLLTVMALVATSCALVLPPTSAHADLQTAGVDNLRTDWDPAEPGLSPADVLGSDFGQLFATQLDGQVYAQPLVVGNMVIVEHRERPGVRAQCVRRPHHLVARPRTGVAGGDGRMR